MKNNGQNLYFLSTIACQLAECLDEKELKLLSTIDNSFAMPRVRE